MRNRGRLLALGLAGALLGAVLLMTLMSNSTGDWGAGRPSPESADPLAADAPPPPDLDSDTGAMDAENRAPIEDVQLLCRAVEGQSGSPAQGVSLALGGRFPTDWESEPTAGGMLFRLSGLVAQDANLTLFWTGHGWLGGSELLESLLARSNREASGLRSVEVPVLPAQGDEILLRVVDAETGLPIAGVTAVRFLGSGLGTKKEPLAASDSDGRVQLSIHRVGGRRVLLLHPGYMPAKVNVGHSPRDLGDARLVKDLWRSRLRVVVPNAPANCLIRVKRKGPALNSAKFKAATNNQFRFGGAWMLELQKLGGAVDDFNVKGNEWEGAGLIPGDYVVTVTAPGVGCFYRELHLKADDIDLEARLGSGATVRIRLESGGDLVKRYFLESKAGVGSFGSETPLLEHILLGEYVLGFDLVSGTRVRTNTDVQITSESLVDVVVPGVGELLEVRGRLLIAASGDEPRPARRTRVQLAGCNVKGRTDEQGGFVLEQVPPGEFTLRSPDHFRARQQQVKIPEGTGKQVIDLGDIVLHSY